MSGKDYNSTGLGIRSGNQESVKQDRDGAVDKREVSDKTRNTHRQTISILRLARFTEPLPDNYVLEEPDSNWLGHPQNLDLLEWLISNGNSFYATCKETRLFTFYQGAP